MITPDEATPPSDAAIGEYCRRVEAHLTRVNAGHLVRIVGAGFELVRRWAERGVPLSVVEYAISVKAERHEARGSKHPLRIEFCEADVETSFAAWRRAIGLSTAHATQPELAAASDDLPGEPKRPSLTKHLDRAIDRLTRAAGRLDEPDSLRETIAGVLGDLTALRDESPRARGDARLALAARLPALDARLMDMARRAASHERAALVAEAEQDLAAYRGRLPGEAWARAVEATVDRLIRDRAGLPVLEVQP